MQWLGQLPHCPLQPEPVAAVQVPGFVTKDHLLLGKGNLPCQRKTHISMQILRLGAVCPGLLAALDDIEHHIEQQILFAIDVMVKAAGENTDAQGQLPHGHGGVAHLDHQFGCSLGQGGGAGTGGFKHRPASSTVRPAAGRAGVCSSAGTGVCQ
ncbi:hypothetical protein D9M68_760380 [compost metagenome]